MDIIIRTTSKKHGPPTYPGAKLQSQQSPEHAHIHAGTGVVHRIHAHHRQCTQFTVHCTASTMHIILNAHHLQCTMQTIHLQAAQCTLWLHTSFFELGDTNITFSIAHCKVYRISIASVGPRGFVAANHTHTIPYPHYHWWYSSSSLVFFFISDQIFTKLREWRMILCGCEDIRWFQLIDVLANQ